jgi:elongation factor P
MQLAALDLRKGTLVRHQNAVQVVFFWNILRNDRRLFVQMKLKDLKTGRVTELKEHGDSKYDVLESSVVELTHSYRDGGEEVFYGKEGDEHRCQAEAAADALKWECESYKGMIVDGQLLFVATPNTVTATVTETAPPVKGDSRLMKPATLENGEVLQVSQLVKVGDKIRLDPETLEFKERA